MVSKIVCITLLVAMVNAATFIGRLPQKPKELAHKEGCYIEEINDVIPFGQSLSLVGKCYRIDCSRHMIHYASCGTVGTEDPKCYVTDTDYRKPYPECCPDVKCDIDNNL